MKMFKDRKEQESPPVEERGRRIALISEHASPLADPGSVDSGGQNVYVAQVARHLARAGHQVDVFTRLDNSDLDEILEWEDGVRVIHVPAGPACFIPKEDLFASMPAFVEYMINFIQSESTSYDLIHANFWMSAFVAAEIKRTLNIPFVVTFHALGKVRRIYQGDADGFPDDRFAIEERIVHEADRIIAECPQDEEDLTQLYHADPKKLVLVPCGFDSSEMWPVGKKQARRELGLDPNEYIVLQLGRMVPRKGVENAIRGLAHLVNQCHVPARLLIVGGGSETPDPKITPEIGRLQAIAEREGIADRVVFTGRRGREVLRYYYAAADVFISTPWYEPFGITPVEAMACGAPVIGSEVGGIKYTVVDGVTGYLVPPREPEVLSERLEKLYRHPELLKRFSKKALQRANQLFTWSRVSELLADCYEEVIAQDQAERLISVEVSAPSGGFAGAQQVIEQTFQDAYRTLRRSQVTLTESILKAADMMSACLNRDGRILVCGNGGSAADAQHFAAELVGRFKLSGRRALAVQALTADTAVLTAWSNDIGFEQVFARQVEAFGRSGDLLLGISTSGKSKNVIAAMWAARRCGVSCIALTGNDGGNLGSLADLALIVPSQQTERIQEVHLIILHLMCDLIEKSIDQTPVLSGGYLLPVMPSVKNTLPLQNTLPVQNSLTVQNTLPAAQPAIVKNMGVS